MQNIATLAKRELGSFFLSPIAYAVNAIFLFTIGLAFALGTFHSGGEASLRDTLDFWMLLILVFVLPMLCMRLMSEEFRNGTIETLMTAPVTESEVIFGKFFGALVFYFVLLATLLLFPIILSMYGPVDIKLLVCHYIGMILVGALYISVSLFFSTLTRHQVIAVLFSFAVLALMTFASHALATKLEGWPRVVLQQISVRTHYHDFVRGVLDMNHCIFFVSMTGFFLFVSVKLLEVRRWQ